MDKSNSAHKRHMALINKKFGKWTVLEKTKVTSHGALFIVQCECGNKSELLQYKFTHGYSTKCLKCSKIKHGKSYSRTYRIWAGIIQRCNNPKNKYYEYYGGRNIKVDERWLHFKNFLDDMGECPLKFELDRINNDGNYEKQNCRWLSRSDNAKNKRRSLKNRDRFLIVDKFKLCIDCRQVVDSL